MKRLLAIFCALAATALLAGCAAPSEDGSINSEELLKAQALVITDVDEAEPREITDEDAVREFVENLDLEGWELADLPEGLEAQRTIAFYQTST